MPLFKLAEQVDVVSINQGTPGNVSDVSEIATFLSQGDVNCSFHLAVTDQDLDTLERVLLDFAEKKSADLTVIGRYRHCRIREIVLGGVTRFMVKHSPVPVLLSH